MRRNYRTAIIVGIGIGIYAMVSLALGRGILPDFNAAASWTIPVWDSRFDGNFDKPSLTLNLEVQAVVLRFCWIFVQQGFYFLFFGVSFSLAFTAISELREHFPIFGILVKSLKLTGLILVAIYLIFVGVMTSAAYGEPVFVKLAFFFSAMPVYALIAVFTPLFWIVFAFSFGLHLFLDMRSLSTREIDSLS